MKRDFSKLEDTPFDLLVIGGGISGAWAAYDAALRGLRVALVEKTDWAAGATSASSKLIHGDLHQLEQRQFKRVRAALCERRLLQALAPHRVRLLDFVMPVFSEARLGRMRLKAGMWLYDRLAGSTRPLETHRYLNREQTQGRNRFIDTQRIKGSFVFGDCSTDDARLALEIVDGAMRAGAVAVNGVQVTRLIEEDAMVRGAWVIDRETEKPLKLEARVTLNCTGPWAGKPFDRQSSIAPPGIRLSKGVHLLMPPLPTRDAFILPTESRGGLIYLIPWYGLTLLGTTDTEYSGDPAHAWVEPRDIHYLLGYANRLLRDTAWEERQIVGSFAGLRAMPAASETKTPKDRREWRLYEQAPGLLTSIGSRLTSARTDAAEAIDRVLMMLGRGHTPSSTADQPLPWCPDVDFEEWYGPVLARGFTLGLDETTADCCAHRYGNRIEKLYERIERKPESARRIRPEVPFCMAEIDHAVEEEMARTLEDVFRRRIPLSILTHLTRDELSELAQGVAESLNWTHGRLKAEINRLVYQPRPKLNAG